MEITTPNGQPVNILGIGGNPKMDRACVPLAYDAGINYFFFYDLTHRPLIEGLKPIVDSYRDNVVVATGTELRDINAVTQCLEEILQTLNIDMLDIFYIEYISPSDDLDELLASDGIFDLLQNWKEKGLIRYVGATAHSRPATVELIKSGKVDVMMHRYNVAHRGAEEHVLPAAIAADMPVVAFTCTRWGSLLKDHPEWNDTLFDAVTCYRYALQHPGIRLAMTAPETTDQLKENLEIFNHPDTLSKEEIDRCEAFGKLVYGDGMDTFEVRWP
jgi:predicted aldo/keto reductase-like oxidoreductase